MRDGFDKNRVQEDEDEDNGGELHDSSLLLRGEEDSRAVHRRVELIQRRGTRFYMRNKYLDIVS